MLRPYFYGSSTATDPLFAPCLLFDSVEYTIVLSRTMITSWSLLAARKPLLLGPTKSLALFGPRALFGPMTLGVVTGRLRVDGKGEVVTGTWTSGRAAVLGATSMGSIHGREDQETETATTETGMSITVMCVHEFWFQLNQNGQSFFDPLSHWWIESFSI